MKQIVQPVNGGRGDAARCAEPRARANRGARPHPLLGDLPGHRARGDRPCPVEPARQGAGQARPGPAGSKEGAHGRAHSYQAGGAQPAGIGRAARLLRGGPRPRDRFGGHRNPAWPVDRDGRGRQGESRGTPGRTRTAVRACACRGQPSGCRVHHDRVDRAARAAACGDRTWLEGRGGGAWADRPARGATCAWRPAATWQASTRPPISEMSPAVAAC